MPTEDDYNKIIGLTSDEIRKNLAINTWNPDKQEIAKRELNRRSIEESIRINKENLISTKSLANATWGLFYITILVAAISIITLLIRNR